MIQVGEYLAAMVCWVAAGAVYSRQHWTAGAPRDRLAAEAFIVTGVVVLAIGWTNAKREDERWSAFFPQRKSVQAHSTQHRRLTVKESLPSRPLALPPGDRRIVVNVPPVYLMDFYNQHAAAQADRLVAVYKGKWLALSGTVYDVSPMRARDEDARFVSVELPGALRTIVSLVFKRPWLDRVSVLKRGDAISVLGKIGEVGRTRFILEDSELL